VAVNARHATDIASFREKYPWGKIMKKILKNPWQKELRGSPPVNSTIKAPPVVRKV